jgi:hypothetical protein
MAGSGASFGTAVLQSPHCETGPSWAASIAVRAHVLGQLAAHVAGTERPVRTRTTVSPRTGGKEVVSDEPD